MLYLGIFLSVFLSVLSGFFFLFWDDVQHASQRKKRIRDLAPGELFGVLRKEKGSIRSRQSRISKAVKEFDAEQRRQFWHNKFQPLSELIKQSGLENTSVSKIMARSVVLSTLVVIVLWVLAIPYIFLILLFFMLTIIAPRWVLTRIRDRRLKEFLEEFPNAVDMIVRAVRSGLPVSDGITMVSNDSKEPLSTEFKRITEGQQLGLTLPESVAGLVKRVPCPEANFFSIVFQVQSQAGGNISDALGNLSQVLRERKRTQAKAKAMAAEAKASAWIIGSLPPIVSTLVYLMSPEYMSVLFNTHTGNLLLGVSAFWMATGIFIMSRMINFKV